MISGYVTDTFFFKYLALNNFFNKTVQTTAEKKKSAFQYKANATNIHQFGIVLSEIMLKKNISSKNAKKF